MTRHIPIYLPENLNESDIVVQTTTRFLNGENAGLQPKLERWNGVDYVVLRYSDAGRILLQPVLIAGKHTLLFHAATDNHDYAGCSRKTTFLSELAEAPKNYQLMRSDSISAIESAQTRLIEWHQKLQFTSTEQSQAVDVSIDSSMTILSGPPGAGKSLAVFAALQALVKRAEVDGSSASILFICETPGLVQYFQYAFHAWYRAPKDKKNLIRVTFSSYEKAIPALLFAEEAFNNVITDPKKAIIFYLQNKGIAIEQQEFILEEWLLNSAILYQDFLNKKSFADSEFSKVGDRQHMVSSELLQSVYENYLDYMRHNQKRINILLQPIHPSSAQYSHVFVDEAHVYSMVQLQTLFLLANQRTFVIDPHQADAPVSTLDAFITWLQHDRKMEAVILPLPVVYRTPENVTIFLNRILRLKNEIHRGVLSKHSYSVLNANNEAKKEIVWLDKEDLLQAESLKECGKSIKFAAILFDEKDRAFAKERYGVDDFQLYSIDQIRGREFDQVVLVHPFSSSIVKEIGADAASIDLKLDSPEHRPSHKIVSFDESKKSHYLNRLLIAVSRTTDILMIDENNNTLTNQARLLTRYLRQDQANIQEKVIALEHIDTPEEIIALAKELVITGDSVRAAEVLHSRLALSDKQIKEVLSSVVSLKIPPVAPVVISEKPNVMNKKEMESHYFGTPLSDASCLLEKTLNDLLERRAEFTLAEIAKNEKNTLLFCQIILEKCISAKVSKKQADLALFLVTEMIVSLDPITRDVFSSAFYEFSKTRIFAENVQSIFKTFLFRDTRQCIFSLMLFFAFEKYENFLNQLLNNLALINQNESNYLFLAGRVPGADAEIGFEFLVKTAKGVAFFKKMLVLSESLRNCLLSPSFFANRLNNFFSRIKQHDEKFFDYLVTMFSKKSLVLFEKIITFYFINYVHDAENANELKRANQYMEKMVAHNMENITVYNDEMRSQQVFLPLTEHTSNLLKGQGELIWASLLTTSQLDDLFSKALTNSCDDIYKKSSALRICQCVYKQKIELLLEGAEKEFLQAKLEQVERQLYFVDASGLTKAEVLQTLYNQALKSRGVWAVPFFQLPEMSLERAEQLIQLRGDRFDYLENVPMKIDLSDLTRLNCRNFDRDMPNSGYGVVAIEERKREKAEKAATSAQRLEARRQK